MRPYVPLEETLKKLVDDPRVRSLSGIEVLPTPGEDGSVAYRAAVELIYIGSVAEKYPVQYTFAVFGDSTEDAFERLGKVLDDWVVLQDLNLPKVLTQEDVFKSTPLGTMKRKEDDPA